MSAPALPTRPPETATQQGKSIEVQGLVVRYGDVTAVDGLDLVAYPGEVIGLLGGNGAGKSSTLRAMAGVNPATAGQLRVAGFDMTDPLGVDRARQVLGYCPDVGGLLRQGTVREHIALGLALHDCVHLWPQAMDLAGRFDLLKAFDRPTSGFSHGMSRRLSVLLAVITARSVLILDEPFDGVDPLGVQVTLDVIEAASAAGLTIVVSTHLLDLIARSATRIVVMASGRQVDTGSPQEFTGVAGQQRYADTLARAREVSVGAGVA